MNARDASQTGHAFRFGWGLDGLRAMASEVAVVVVVDVLRSTTAICAALEAGGTVVACTPPDRIGCPDPDAATATLSPTDLMRTPPAGRVVLPESSGSTIACEAAELGVECVLAGCLRNATVTAGFAALVADGRPIGVIAAGERADASHDLRPCLEDLVGAGAVLRALDPPGAATEPACSPDARAARAAFVDARTALHDTLAGTASGVALTRTGNADDVATASRLDIAWVVARLVGRRFVAVSR